MDAGRTEVLIVGGGPAGAVAAAILARSGIACVLMERDRFPRYHIGESLLPSVLTVLDAIGLRATIENHGFVRKFGGVFRWGPDTEVWKLAFGELEGLKNYAFQVIRSEFDELLLKHARNCGATVLESTFVREVDFEPSGRPTAAVYKSADSTGDRRIVFRYLIDASGRFGLMANHMLKTRIFHPAFDNIAIWRYWTGGKPTPLVEGGIITEATPLGWIWYIPLHDGTTSVGVVTSRSTATKTGASISPELIYRSVLKESRIVSQQLEMAQPAGQVRVERDYSYHNKSFTGPGYFIAGDAACFIDPVLSSGVHLATMSGLMAAACVRSSLLDKIDEDEARTFYERSYQTAFYRFIGFLSAFYDQNRQKFSYFWEQRHLTEAECSAAELQRAFINLVTGEQDLRDLTRATSSQEIVESLVSAKISENIRLRNAPAAPNADHGGSHRFVSGVEGLFPCSASEAVDGIYLQLTPEVKLKRAT